MTEYNVITVWEDWALSVVLVGPICLNVLVLTRDQLLYASWSPSSYSLQRVCQSWVSRLGCNGFFNCSEDFQCAVCYMG